MRVQTREHTQTDRRRRSAVVKPLGYNDLCTVADAVALVAPDWCVELSCSVPGESSLVIMPEGADDLIGPTFVVHQHRGGFRLDQFQWDALSGIGEYSNLPDALRAVLACLDCLLLNAPAYSTLRH